MRGLALVFWKKHAKSMDACWYAFVSLCEGVGDGGKKAEWLGELLYLAGRYNVLHLTDTPRDIDRECVILKNAYISSTPKDIVNGRIVFGKTRCSHVLELVRFGRLKEGWIYRQSH